MRRDAAADMLFEHLRAKRLDAPGNFSTATWRRLEYAKRDKRACYSAYTGAYRDTNRARGNTEAAAH
jgi:hypothetical protein